MRISNLQKGQSLMEILFAVAVFTIGFITIGYLVIDAEHSLIRNIEFTQAQLLAREGLEAVRIIRDRDWNDVTVGTYGIVFEDNTWNFTLESSDTTSKFVRSIIVTETAQGMKEILSTVVWNDSLGHERSLSLVGALSDWRGPRGGFTSFVVDTTNVALSETQEAITTLQIQNIGLEPIIISGMMFEWDNSHTLHQIVVNGEDVFFVPSDSELSIRPGEVIDTTDFELVAGSSPLPIDSIVFDGPMLGSTVLVTFMLGDGSMQSTSLSF
jgi:Tfp pilus assembly protein PilV